MGGKNTDFNCPFDDTTCYLNTLKTCPWDGYNCKCGQPPLPKNCNAAGTGCKQMSAQESLTAGSYQTSYNMWSPTKAPDGSPTKDVSGSYVTYQCPTGWTMNYPSGSNTKGLNFCQRLIPSATSANCAVGQCC